jgi:histone arginine demethylase JMJD6
MRQEEEHKQEQEQQHRGDGNAVRDLRDRKFKCGEDDDGHSVKVKLRHFLEYLRRNRDDSPLYVFDSGFDDDSVARSLLEDYRVPSYFDDDLFRLVSESRRPPYRWFLVGPERSGTCVHVDPLATNAWNTLIEGRKRWVLFPPHVPKAVAKGRGLVGKDEDDEAIHYFMHILPRIKKKAMAYRDHGDDPRYRDFACYEFTQNPGETVFVPNGWWHAVLNLTHTVGVTQNYCSPRNFDKVWIQTRSGRKRMAWKWLQQLESHHPDLARRARELNERDGFRMKYDPAEIERRRRQGAAAASGAAGPRPASPRSSNHQKAV